MKECKEHGCMCDGNGIVIGLDGRMDAIMATATKSGNLLMDDDGKIVFDTKVEEVNSNITLDTTTGVFKVLQGGSYIVNYYVNVVGTGGSTNVSFAVNGVITTASSAVEGQMSCFAILNLKDGDTISVTNASGQQVRLANSDIQAGILIRRN